MIADDGGTKMAAILVVISSANHLYFRADASFALAVADAYYLPISDDCDK